MRGGVGWGGISNRGCRLGHSPSTSFFFLCSEVAAGDQVIEVRCCCCPGGLLGGLPAGREGLQGIFKRRRGVGCSPFIYLLCFRIEVAAGDRVIEVHRCCCPGGLLGGLGAGRGWLGGV